MDARSRKPVKRTGELGFYLLIGAMVAAVGTMVATGSLPERSAADFNALTDVSIPANYTVIRQPTADDNTFIYAINNVAATTVPIAQGDTRVKDIIEAARSESAAITIAAIQPTVSEFRNDGKTSYSSAGMLRITVNQQVAGGRPYVEAASFDQISGKRFEAYQRVWNVLVDLDKGIVTDVQLVSDRAMTQTAAPDTIYLGTNMFMPGDAKVAAGTTIRWLSTSDLPHNIMGVYTTSSKTVPIDSGFFQKGESWKYTFDEAGIFEYHCSTHSEDGMKGSIIITS